MKIRCLIIDDEPLAIRLIENHISKIDQLEVVAKANSVFRAFEIINTQPVDLMFLDVKMPTLSGIDFLKTLKNPPQTIITTAYRDFALEGFELEVIDYLLKPITFERFFKSIDRLLRTHYERSKPQSSACEDEHIIIKSGVKNYRVKMTDILYIESLRDYIKVHTMDQKEIMSKNRISGMESMIPKSQFLRVHRSYIINTNRISAFSSGHIEVNGIEIPIGASYKESVDVFLEAFRR